MRRALAVGAVLAVMAALGASSAAAPASSPGLFLASGSLVAFTGTSLQCLVFGPIASVQGKRGVICFKGLPKQRARGTRWIVITPVTAISGAGTTRTLKTVFAQTKIHFNVKLPLKNAFEVSALRYVTEGQQARLQCRFAVIPLVDPGQKAVTCADTSGDKPIPGSTGIVISQRRAAFITFSAGRVTVNRLWRQPPCACDK